DAVSDDITAIFWNPAGLVYMSETSVYLSHISWLAEIEYEAVGIARTFKDIGSFGFSVSYLNSGDIEETTFDEPEGTGDYFTCSDMMLGLTYARRLTDKFSFGFNLKYIREQLDDLVSTAWSTDFGVLYYTDFKSLRLGMSIRNFGPEIRLSGDYYDYDNGTQLSDPSDYLAYHFPMTFKLGAAMELVETEENRVTIAADLVHPNDNLERINTGIEAVLWKTFALRGGYTFRHDTAGPAAGAGFLWKGMTINYSYSDYGILDWVQRFDFVFNL
ncbi:MAG: PorV/PorQ family protein, partial [FCB group bacterium]|nr:PorV/PorQ family protein [FCB group bacterium]